MRKIILLTVLPLALASCNSTSTSQLISDVGVIAGGVAQIECARINPARIPAGVAVCQTLAGDLISIAQAKVQGALAGKK